MDLEMPRAAPIWRVLNAPACSSCSVCRILLMVTLGVGIAGSGQKTGQRMPRLGHSEHPQVSAIKMECCPPSPWNGVRHDGGTLSAISVESCPPSRGIRSRSCVEEDFQRPPDDGQRLERQ